MDELKFFEKKRGGQKTLELNYEPGESVADAIRRLKAMYKMPSQVCYSEDRRSIFANCKDNAELPTISVENVRSDEPKEEASSLSSPNRSESGTENNAEIKEFQRTDEGEHKSEIREPRNTTGRKYDNRDTGEPRREVGFGVKKSRSRRSSNDAKVIDYTEKGLEELRSSKTGKMGFGKPTTVKEVSELFKEDGSQETN